MIIYNKTGVQLLDVEVDDSSFGYRELGGDDYLSIHFSLSRYVEVPLGSYVVVSGIRYTLIDPEAIKMQHSRNYDYTIIFEAPLGLTKIYRVRNTVDGRLNFPLTAKPIEHIQLIVDNMNERDGGGWSVGECLDAVEKAITYNYTTCYDALMLIVSNFETELEVNNRTISLRKVEYNRLDPLVLAYGKGNGIRPGMGRGNYNSTRPARRLFVQGGERNINRTTYGSPTLRLPKSGTIAYDGNFFEDEEGYKAIGATTYRCDASGSYVESDVSLENIADDVLDCTEIYPSRVGEVSAVTTTEYDNDDGTTGYHYFIEDSSIPASLNFNNYLIPGEGAMRVVFQSGMLAGKEFDARYYHTDAGGAARREFLLLSAEIDGQTMPGGEFVPAKGDKYAVFGVMLPQSYIDAYTGITITQAKKEGASWDMFRKAVRYLAENQKAKYTFTTPIDPIFARGNWDEVEPKLVLGGYADINYNTESFSGTLRITSIKQFLNNPYKLEIGFGQLPSQQGVKGELRRIASREAAAAYTQKQSAEAFNRRILRVQNEAGGPGTGAVDVVLYVPQTLTTAQQAQARTNIGAANAEDVVNLGQSVANQGQTLTNQQTQLNNLAEAVENIEVPIRGLKVGSEAVTPTSAGIVEVGGNLVDKVGNGFEVGIKMGYTGGTLGTLTIYKSTGAGRTTVASVLINASKIGAITEIANAPGSGFEFAFSKNGTKAEVSLQPDVIHPTSLNYSVGDGSGVVKANNIVAVANKTRAMIDAARKDLRQYTIHTRKENSVTSDIISNNPYTVIEGVTEADLTELADSTTYRLVLMRWRKPVKQSPRWAIPMLPYVDGRDATTINSHIAEVDTWWPITGKKVEWFSQSGNTMEEILPLGRKVDDAGIYFFKNSRNRVMRLGVAIFRKVADASGAGWVRVSNIATVTLFVDSNNQVLLSQRP